MTYALKLNGDEVDRYRLMAQRARERESDLWALAGLRPGAAVADIGCGPGAMLAALAEVVGPTGSVVGIDADEEAVRTASALLDAFGSEAGPVADTEIRVGHADDTGLPEGSFDTVVLRHVLAHNGGAEARIVEHLARLVRPGGHVFVVDVDMRGISVEPSEHDLDDLHDRYLRWHTSRGNDLGVGRRLARLGRGAGLAIEEFRGWFEIAEQPPGFRGPAWAARDALVCAGLADEADVVRWDAAFERVHRGGTRPEFMLPVFAAVCRR
ncbi:MAG TPA: methyltransferase domain-containing protein [Pseudonocardia sp.]|jgi:SAM-dependent methyltransferase|nr:methyltransferase domain-containing protein [Pseudonocardia sp.]